MAEAKGNVHILARLAEKDPDAAARIHPNNLKKIIRALEVAENSGSRIMPFEHSFVQTADYEVELICLNRERQELYGRINKRVDKLIEQGLVEEVGSLINMGLTSEDVSMKGIGYKEIIGHLGGEYDISAATEMIKQNTRKYAKRQLTWFRRYDKMKWFDLSAYNDDDEAMEGIFTWLRERK